jgi:hypothetical protein
MEDYEGSQCKLAREFKRKLQLQPHELSSPSYSMGQKLSVQTTSTGPLGPEYYVEDAFRLTSRARSAPFFTFGIRNDNLVAKPIPHTAPYRNTF